MKLLSAPDKNFDIGSIGRTDEIFADVSKCFFRSFSQALLARKTSKNYSDLAALGFWCRKANVQYMEQHVIASQSKSYLVKPVGTVFQVAPSNVEALFLYTGLLSMLLGNCTVTRVSSEKSAIFEELIEILQNSLALPEFASIASRFFVVDFPHDHQTFSDLSAQCDLRMLWGASLTIHQLRQKPLAAHAKELTFSGKTSLALISLTQVVALKEQSTVCTTSKDKYQRLLEGFCRDAFSFNQQACSSVKLVIWMFDGDKSELDAAAAGFWRDIDDCCQAHYTAKVAAAMERLTAEQSLAVAKLNIESSASFQCFRVLKVSGFNNAVHQFHSGNGLFLEMKLASLDQLPELLDKDHQTLSYFGVPKESLKKCFNGKHPRSINRIVPVGSSVNFNHHWDGYDLTAELTRQITIL